MIDHEQMKRTLAHLDSPEHTENRRRMELVVSLSETHPDLFALFKQALVGQIMDDKVYERVRAEVEPQADAETIISEIKAAMADESRCTSYRVLIGSRSKARKGDLNRFADLVQRSVEG